MESIFVSASSSGGGASSGGASPMLFSTIALASWFMSRGRFGRLLERFGIPR
jgi:hypothetical protein